MAKHKKHHFLFSKFCSSKTNYWNWFAVTLYMLTFKPIMLALRIRQCDHSTRYVKDDITLNASGTLCEEQTFLACTFCFPISDHVMHSWEFSFCFFFNSYVYICTCMRRHLKETIPSSSITWSEMRKQNIQAKEVYRKVKRPNSRWIFVGHCHGRPEFELLLELWNRSSGSVTRCPATIINIVHPRVNSTPFCLS